MHAFDEEIIAKIELVVAERGEIEAVAAFNAAIICSPWNTLEATDGDRKSPASTSRGVRPEAAICCFKVATRASPPTPSIGTVV